MRALAAIPAVLALAAPPLPVLAQEATGQVAQNSAECSADTASTNPSDCVDVIEAAVAVSPSDVGRTGAIYVAVLPVSAATGQPTGYQGGYATPNGWQVGPTPDAYFVGPLPAQWSHRFEIPGGVCAAAAAHGAPRGNYVVYAGYGVSTQVPAAATPNGTDIPTLLQQAEATGNPDLVKQVRELAAEQNGVGADASRAAAGSAGAEMLQAHTVWPIGRINCE